MMVGYSLGKEGVFSSILLGNTDIDWLGAGGDDSGLVFGLRWWW